MRERLFVQLSTVVMRIISKSFEVSARKITQNSPLHFMKKVGTALVKPITSFKVLLKRNFRI